MIPPVPRPSSLPSTHRRPPEPVLPSTQHSRPSLTEDSPTRRPTHHSHTRHDRPQDGTSTPGTLTALSRSQLTVTTHLHFSHTPAPSVCAAPRRHMQTPHRVPCPRCTRTQRPSVRHTTHPAHVKRRHYRLEDSCHSTHTVCLCTVIRGCRCAPPHDCGTKNTHNHSHDHTHTGHHTMTLGRPLTVSASLAGSVM